MKTMIACAIAMLLGACGGIPGTKQKTPRATAADFNVQLGIEYLRQGNLMVAKEKLERAEKQNYRDPKVHDALALLYERLDKPELVEKQYRAAVRLAPNDPNIVNNYAVYLCKTGRADEGVRRFKEAAGNRLYNTPAAALTNAGVCLRNAKRYDEAQENFLQALKVRPNFAEAAYQLADLDISQGRPNEARFRVDAFLASYPATADLLLIGVRAAHALGDRLSAERYARRLRVEFPGSTQSSAIPDLKNPG